MESHAYDTGNAQSQIIKWLSLLHATDDVIELRIPKANKRGTISGYFDDRARLAEVAVRESNKHQGIYVTLNPVTPELLARASNRVVDWASGLTTDNLVLRRRNLLIDLDPSRPSGISSTDSEHVAAIEIARRIRAGLSKLGWPEPLLADSGNGAHLIYRIDLPPEDGGLVQRILNAVALRWGDESVEIDTTVHNASQLVKLYGTMARKGDSTNDRPHRQSCVLEAPGELQCTPIDMLEALAADIMPAPQSTDVPRMHSNFDLSTWMRQHAPGAEGPRPWRQQGQIWVFSECPWREGDGNTAFVLQLPSGAIFAGCQHATCPGSRATGNHWRELRESLEGERTASIQYTGTSRVSALDRESQPFVNVAVPSEGGNAMAQSYGPRVWTLDKLLETQFSDPAWIVPEMLPVGLGLLAGRPKQGKSFLALQLALSVASGSVFLEHCAAQAPALYIALEDSARRLQWRLTRMGATPTANLQFALDWLKLNTREGIDTLTHTIRSQKLALVVVDTLARAVTGRIDWDDLAQVTAVLGALQDLAMQMSCCILLVDHHRKGKGLAADTVDDVMGSTGKSAVADTIWGLYRRRGDHRATLAVTGRDIDEGEVDLLFDTTSCTWRLQSTSATTPSETLADKITDQLRARESATTTQLAQILQRDAGQVNRELGSLVDQGVVVRCAQLGREVPYRLAPDTPTVNGINSQTYPLGPLTFDNIDTLPTGYAAPEPN